MARSVVGLFTNRSAAEHAVEDLKAAGFDPSRIGFMMKDAGEARDVAAEHGTSAGEGAVAGGVMGGALGAILAATGTLVIPGIGPFIAGGILATAVTGAAAGGIVGALTGLGLPKEEAEFYQNRLKQGNILVTVEAANRDAEARQILLRDGAEELQGQGFAGESNTDQDIRVPVMEEELVVGKRDQEQGRVHLHKDVVEEQETVNVPLRREEVVVERVATNKAADFDTNDSFVERDIEMPLMGEEAVVSKQARVTEEVRLHKDVVTEQQSVSDTVRKERVTVDDTEANRPKNY